MDFCNERIRSKSIKECSSSKENDGNVMRVITFFEGREMKNEDDNFSIHQNYGSRQGAKTNKI